jgi:hypothetical protein
MSLTTKIEELIKTKILSASIVLPITLFGSTFALLRYIFPSETSNHKLLQGLLASTVSLIATIFLLVTYIFLLRKEMNQNPDFSNFVHDNENAYWVERTTGERICEACKTENKKTPLSRYGGGWKCPLHPNIVGYRQSTGPINLDHYRNTVE